MGREPQVVTKHFKSRYEGDKDVTVELLPGRNWITLIRWRLSASNSSLKNSNQHSFTAIYYQSCLSAFRNIPGQNGLLLSNLA